MKQSDLHVNHLVERVSERERKVVKLRSILLSKTFLPFLFMIFVIFYAKEFFYDIRLKMYFFLSPFSSLLWCNWHFLVLSRQRDATEIFIQANNLFLKLQSYDLLIFYYVYLLCAHTHKHSWMLMSTFDNFTIFSRAYFIFSRTK